MLKVGKMNKTDEKNTAIFYLDNISVEFKTRRGSVKNPEIVKAVSNLSLSLKPGQTLGLVGESGCGKSTTANVVCGLQDVTSGKVYFKGKDVTKRKAQDRFKIGRVASVIFQDPATSLNPRMKVIDQLCDSMIVHKIGNKEQMRKHAKEIIETVGLPSSVLPALPSQLSGGQRQRVAIARALMLDPDIIVADEPTSALDVSVRAQILNLLTRLKKQFNLSMMFISHDIQTVRYVSDYIMVMNKGNIVEQGSCDEVFNHSKDEYTKKLLSAAPSLIHSIN